MYQNRNGIWRISFTDSNGRRRDLSLRTRDEDEARELAKVIYQEEERKRLKREMGHTVRTYAEVWRNRRRERNATADLDYQRLRDHVFPELGDAYLSDIDFAALVNWCDTLFLKDISPKTRWNIWGALRKMLRDAYHRGHAMHEPPRLGIEELGEKRDADPEWRPSALFSRDECEALISDERLDIDHRLIHGLGVLAGLRLGEVAGLRWSDVDLEVGRLRVAKSYDGPTKTGVVRDVPIHTTLRPMLAEWRLVYRGEFAVDILSEGMLVVPSMGQRSHGRMYTSSTLSKRFRPAAKLLGIDTGKRRGKKGGRSFHDLRATFVEMCIEDGARPDVIESITHTKMMRSAFDAYRRVRWETKVEEIAKLQLARRLGRKAEQR